MDKYVKMLKLVWKNSPERKDGQANLKDREEKKGVDSCQKQEMH